MFDLMILAIGKLKEKYFLSAFEEYVKRSSPYAKIEVVELEAESFGKNDGAKAQKIEGDKIMKFLAKRPEASVFIFDEHGREFSSVEFSEFLVKEKNKIILVIGGSLGLANEILIKYPVQLALSKMTMPHELARVVLAEQIYRAVTIEQGKEYHH
jgi:23S rRNA (pseudouridine1915-N3)-methyltransferase